MNQLSEFQGICPICYKPIKTNADSRILMNGNREEAYHNSCLVEYVHENAPAGKNPLVLSILEQHKKLILGHDVESRMQWIMSNAPEWQYKGAVLRGMRQQLGISAKIVAGRLGISTKRLKRFEEGFPVKDARLLESAYNMFFDCEMVLQLYMSTQLNETKPLVRECDDVVAFGVRKDI